MSGARSSDDKKTTEAASKNASLKNAPRGLKNGGGPLRVISTAMREHSEIKRGSTAASLESVADVESFIYEDYEAWGGTDEDRIMSYYAENVVLQIPGLLMEGKEAVRDQFARPFITAFPGNRHLVKNMIFGPSVVVVEFSFEAEHKGPFAEDLALMEAAARIALIAIERQRSQEALREALGQIQKSESRLRQVIDAIPTLAWCNLPDGPNEFLNKGWHEYTGISPEESYGWGWQAAFHPDDLPPLMENWVAPENSFSGRSLFGAKSRFS